MKYDYLIVGSGLFGAVFAHQAAAAGKHVLVVEKRHHLGGNIYTENIDGIQVHKYGAHIFHTNDKAVWEFVNRFVEFNRYTNSPVANYHGEIYSLPFNMLTFNKMWGCVSPAEAAEIIERQRQELKGEPKNLEEQAIQLVGRDIFEKLIQGYTEKQWGRRCQELPPFIIKRLPVRYTYDNNYFNARFQGIPVEGYTRLVEKLLEGIEIWLDYNYLEHKAEADQMAERVVYTGPLDAFFQYRLGNLEYRSVRFEVEKMNVPNFQGNAVVNYTDADTPWTRIIEHKWFNFGKNEAGEEIPTTVISREYSSEWHFGEEPYYPINDEKNNHLAMQYRELAASAPKVSFGGRLADYKYYDMDKIVFDALQLSEKELSK